MFRKGALQTSGDVRTGSKTPQMKPFQTDLSGTVYRDGAGAVDPPKAKSHPSVDWGQMCVPTVIVIMNMSVMVVRVHADQIDRG